MHSRSIALALLCSFVSHALAALRNITIDDTNGNNSTLLPIYNPIWNDPSCTGCKIRPNPSQATQGTWRETTYQTTMPSATFELNFQGSAIYLYFILSNTIQTGLITGTTLNVTLDGNLETTFSHAPTGSVPELIYNQLVFAKTNLSPNDTHKLIAGVTDKQNFPSWMAFDYAVVTVDDSLASSTADGSRSEDQHRTVVSPVALGLIGGLVGLVVLAALVLFLWRRRRNQGSARSSSSMEKGTPLAQHGAPLAHLTPVPTNGSSFTYLNRSESYQSSVANAPHMRPSYGLAPPYSVMDRASWYSSDGTSYDLQQATSGPPSRRLSHTSSSYRTSNSNMTYVSTYALDDRARQKDLEDQVTELRLQLESRDIRDMQDDAERSSLRSQVQDLQHRIQAIHGLPPPPMPTLVARSLVGSR